MSWAEFFAESGRTIVLRHELIAAGAKQRDLAEAVHAGELVRVRRGYYALHDTDPHILKAVRVGGRLACVSVLAQAGAFVFDSDATHIHLEHGSSRLRAPNNRRRRLSSHNRDGSHLHWWPLLDERETPAASVSTRDALLQAVRCQPASLAVATLDSALHLKLISTEQLDELFRHLPKRFRALASRTNGRSESGQESVLRLIVEDMGLDYEIQVSIAGVGRVDMLIAGVLVVEAEVVPHKVV